MTTNEHDDPALKALLTEAAGTFAPPAGLKEAMRIRVVTRTTHQPAIRPDREASYGPAEGAQRGVLSRTGRRHSGRSIMRRIAIPGGAVAATVALAVVAYQFVNPKGSGSAFAAVVAAMQKVPWVHVAGTWQHGTEPPSPAEEWMGFEALVTARKKASGQIEYKDYRSAQQWGYEPQTRQLTVSRLRVDNEPFALGAADPRQFMDRLIEAEKSHGARLSVRQDKRDGRAVTVFTLDRTEKNLREHVEVFVDARTNLMVAFESSDTDAAGAPVFHCNGQMDYPASGPVSIHDLGVPADAVVVDQRPGPQVEQLLDKYKAALKSFDSRFVAVRTVGPADRPGLVQYAYITYVDGERYRLEVRENTAFPAASPLDAVGAGDSVGSLVARWTSSPGSKLIGMTIDDGFYTYNIDCGDSAETRDPPGKSRHTGFLGRELGWPGIDGDRASIVPDDYSRQNELIRVELKKYVHQGKVVVPPHVFYLDPRKDYNCHRMVWTSSHGKRNIMHVQEYARTPSGHWYPRVELRRGVMPGTDARTESLHTIWVSTDAPIPADAFDATPFVQKAQ